MPDTAYILLLAERSVLELDMYLPLQCNLQRLWHNSCIQRVLRFSGTLDCGQNCPSSVMVLEKPQGRGMESVSLSLGFLPHPGVAASFKVGSRGTPLNPGWYQSSYVNLIWQLTALNSSQGQKAAVRTEPPGSHSLTLKWSHKIFLSCTFLAVEVT